jgi:hypothetical protein
MLQRSRLAALSALLVAAACSPDVSDTPSAPVAPPAAVPISRSSTEAEATPVSMTIFPNEIVADGTNSATARVEVGSSIACCDRTLEVSSNNSAVLPFLSGGATVAAGTSFAGIAIDPTRVSQRTVVTIFATGNGVTVSANIILDPPGTTIAPTLSSFTVSPGTVNAGTTATGTITIPNPAPAGGFVVSVGSRQPDDASVPPSVTVPAGETSVSFPVTTFIGFPNSTDCVRLVASTSTDVVEGDICVVTGSTTTSGPLAAPTQIAPGADRRFSRGSNITFDWSDVAGAASYELQIDDRDTFPAPLILDQTVAASQLSTSNLPSRTMFWRVRAISSSGVAGSWSAVRRFEIK